jgi:hypothetical protein
MDYRLNENAKKDLIERIPRGSASGSAEKFEKRQVFHNTLKKCKFVI